MKAIVVGGSSGIGEAAAKLFAKMGADVIIAGRDRERLDVALARVRASEGGAHARGEVADGSLADSSKRLFESVGAFDHLVLSISGARGAGPLAVLPIDEIRAGFEAKLFTQLTVLKAALPFVKASVTLVSAATAVAALPGTTGLAAINGAVEAIVRPLAIELAPVRVNAVRPGVIDTPWWNNVPKEFQRAVFEQATQSLPVKRVGTPEDVASAIVMLATNGFVTGTVVDVSGGGTLAR